MTSLNVRSIQTGELKSDVLVDGGAVTVRLTGTADTPAKPLLDQFLAAVHSEALRTQTRELVVDLRALEFMNSSCFKSFVTWLGQLQELPHTEQYSIRFRSDPRKHWQQRSLGALACFAVSLIRIETT